MPPRNQERYRSATVPNLPPDSAVAYNQQLQQLYLQRQDALQALRQQRAEIRTGFRIAKAGIERERNLAMERAVNLALERGLLGGSTDLEQRLGVRAEAAQRLAEAINARNQALLANLAQAMASRREFAMGLANIAASRAAEQALIDAQMFATGMGLYAGGAGFGAGGEGDRMRLQDLSKRKQERIRSLSHSIRNVLNSIATTPLGPDRQHYIQQLQALWTARNRLRQQFGLSPVPPERMQELIDQVVAAHKRAGTGQI